LDVPTLLQIGPHRWFIVMADCDEREPVHVESGHGAAKFWLEPFVRLAATKGYATPELRRLERLTNMHRERLLEGWNQACP